MVRDIIVTVDAYGGTDVGNEPQYAGVQGEHNLCRIAFDVTDWVTGGEDYAYRGEYVDGNGYGWTTDIIEPVEDSGAYFVSYNFPGAWTAAGGKGAARLVASTMVDNVETERVYVVDVPVYFKAKQEVDPQSGRDLFAGLTGLITDVHDAADYATAQGDYAKDKGDDALSAGAYANGRGQYAQGQGDYAKAQGDYAKEQGDAAKQAETDLRAAAAAGDFDGADGKDGGYYAPIVDAAGDLSWTAIDPDIPAGTGANIKCPQGDTGATGPQGPQGVGLVDVTGVIVSGTAQYGYNYDIYLDFDSDNSPTQIMFASLIAYGLGENDTVGLWDKNNVNFVATSQGDLTADPGEHLFLFDQTNTVWIVKGDDGKDALIDDTLTIEGEAADAKATGDAVDFVGNYVYDKIPTSLPDVVKGKFQISPSATGDMVISGTHNVSELLQIKEGTYSINGVTIVISDDTVSVTGQPSPGFYFEFSSGTVKTTTELANMTLDLPEHLYTLSQKVTSGTVFPSIFVRSKSSGNIVQAQDNTAQFTMDKTTCGGFHMLCSASKNYSCTFKIALMPFSATNASPYREQSSDVDVYTDGGVYDLDGYTWAVGSPVVTELKSKLPKNPLCKYSTRTIAYTGATEVLDVYIPAKNGYINYVFGHTVSVPENGDVWRLIQIDSVNDALMFKFHITQLGETEMAIKIKGRDDFIGGITHGDETIVSGSFLAVMDGAPVDITTLTSETEFETLQLFLVTNMYDPNDHTTKVGEHGREWRFDKTGLLLDQTVKFTANLTLVSSYMPMLCAIRGNDTVSADQITDTYVDDGNFQQYDVGTGGFTTYPNTLKADVTDMHLFGKTSGVRASVELLERPTGLNGEGTYVYNGVNTYNKIYCAVCGYNNAEQNVSNGDKWHVKAKITVDAG